MAIKKSNNDINARMFYALKVSEESRVPFLFISAPGMGKSTTVEMFAKIRGYHLVMLRGNSESPEGIMGYDAVPAGENVTTTRHFRPTWYDTLLANEAKGEKTLLFLDEITTAPQHVQAALLHLVLERRVGNEDLPKSTLVVSAGNYAQSLGSTFDLIAPLMNRFCIFNVVPGKNDIRMFLSKYEGAATGKKSDVIAEKTAMLAQLDKKQVSYDEASHDKIAEFIERGFVDVVDMLQNSGQKVVDFKVTDLQGLYQDNDNDNTLKGFITPRTLCFLRDATISAYFAFGKDGIQGENYHLLVEGLCGIGLSRRGNNNEVVVTDIAKDFEQQMKLVVTEIDKMSNDKLPVYNKYFTDLIDQCKDKKGNPVFTNEIITSAFTKMKEMMSDKDIAGIERPLETTVLEPVIKAIQSYLANISGKVTIDANKKVSVTTSELAGIITQWNSCALFGDQIKNLVTGSKYGYSEPIKKTLSDSLDKIRRYSYALKIVKRFMEETDPTTKSLFQELDTKFATA